MIETLCHWFVWFAIVENDSFYVIALTWKNNENAFQVLNSHCLGYAMNDSLLIYGVCSSNNNFFFFFDKSNQIKCLAMGNEVWIILRKKMTVENEHTPSRLRWDAWIETNTYAIVIVFIVGCGQIRNETSSIKATWNSACDGQRWSSSSSSIFLKLFICFWPHYTWKNVEELFSRNHLGAIAFWLKLWRKVSHTFILWIMVMINIKVAYQTLLCIAYLCSKDDQWMKMKELHCA